MIVDAISDLHGHYPTLEGGDLLIVAGDLTARDTFGEHSEFKQWLYDQDYEKKVVIGGNHDGNLVGNKAGSSVYSGYHMDDHCYFSFADYLLDSGTEFGGLKIWGSPWTKTFKGMNPHCKAFTCDTEEELAEKWALIPDNTDILITHSPPYGFLDFIEEKYDGSRFHLGSKSLWDRLIKINVRIHIFGHIHECGGSHDIYEDITWKGPYFVNASHVNERYEPVNKPIRVIL